MGYHLQNKILAGFNIYISIFKFTKREKSQNYTENYQNCSENDLVLAV